jgi:medium-chain acyl-[acyl-carrier-protein] hydrolase
MLEFEKKYRIPVYDSDFMGRLSVASFFNYIQDIASEHAELLHFGRDDLQKSNHFWILARLRAEIRSFPKWGETVILRTWPRGTEGLFALRDIEVRLENGDIIAGATTSWVIVDALSRRPQRPDVLLKRMNLEYPDKRTTLHNAGKIDLNGDVPVNSPEFYVRPSDLDVNFHVNNVKYIQWVTDTFPTAFLSCNTVVSLDVNYLSESIEGNKVIIHSKGPLLENNCSHHSVIRVDDGKELCRILIQWQPVPNEKFYTFIP